MMTRLMLGVFRTTAALLIYCSTGAAVYAADAASEADKAFVAKVSQGGMFEVALGKVAAEKGSTQMIRDNGATEMHDHELVGAKLKAVSHAAGLDVPATLNEAFQSKLDKLSTLSGPEFDAAYVVEMEQIHRIDGGLFLQEAKDGGSGPFKEFAAETHSIVGMHIGALRGTGLKLLP